MPQASPIFFQSYPTLLYPHQKNKVFFLSNNIKSYNPIDILKEKNYRQYIIKKGDNIAVVQ